jgi:uncharacterized protein YjbI with pentapeptide repeats
MSCGPNFQILSKKQRSGGAEPDSANKKIRDKLRRLLPSNIFVQILAGPPELRHGIFGFMLKLIAATTLVAFPILLLLLLQIQFLPFHDLSITNAQRTALVFDIVLLWLLQRPVFAGLSGERSGYPRVFVRALQDFGLVFAVVASTAALWFSIVVATIPGEWQETALAALDPPRWQVAFRERDQVQERDVTKTKLVSTHELLFAGEVDETTRRRRSLFSNTLVLPGFNLYEALKIDDPKRLAWKEHLFDLRGRHLERGVFDGADLTKADLTGAHLQGASLFLVKLQGAALDYAQLQGASFGGRAKLEGALRDYAKLQGAVLFGAQLQGWLRSLAKFPGEWPFRAQLQGASLGFAQLEGASLDLAQLQGAVLYSAQLQGAVLFGAQLQGAVLFGAQLQGAVLSFAQLQGAWLDSAQLQGASLFGAQLHGASLESTQLQGASLGFAQLQGAWLLSAQVRATDFRAALLWRTQWQIDPTQFGPVHSGDKNKDAAWKAVWRPVDSDPDFEPLPWDTKAYAALRNSMNNIPEGQFRVREAALERIKSLDCTAKALGSCNPAAKPPPAVLDWQNQFARANVDDAAYSKALATELQNLVCANDANAIHILRGLSNEYFGPPRLAAAGREASALVDFIMSKDCPVSAALTDDDNASLLQLKQDAEKKFPPPPVLKKEK